MTVSLGMGKHVPHEEGIYHFRGIRTQTSGKIVVVNDLVQVSRVIVGRVPMFEVAFFGRYRKFEINNFEGSWRQLDIDFEGE